MSWQWRMVIILLIGVYCVAMMTIMLIVAFYKWTHPKQKEPKE